MSKQIRPSTVVHGGWSFLCTKPTFSKRSHSADETLFVIIEEELLERSFFHGSSKQRAFTGAN